jgi:hypothetical protein
VAYQVTAAAWQAIWNGTASGVRLQASPAPKTCLASSIAISMV